MTIAAILVLFGLGLCMGSFLGAMVWRIYHKMDWVRDRSRCDHCGHQLSALDLVPVFSWLFLGRKCRYCHRRLSWQHPAVELATGLIFALSYIFWPGGVHGAGQWVLFVDWLLVVVGLMALLVYDFRWMLLPNKVLYPTFFIAAVGRLIYIVGFAQDKPHVLLEWALSVLVASGIFWVLFTISRGRWIGYGDVRLGLVTGTVLAAPDKSLLMILLASILGTIFVIPSLVIRSRGMNTRLPYGPFLIMATAIVLLFGDSIINWYKNLLLP